MQYYTQFSSPIGPVTACCDGTRLTALRLRASLSSDGINDPKVPVLVECEQWLDAYFSGQCMPRCVIPMDPGGTAFQRFIWDMLDEIPYGTAASYGFLAVQAAEKMGVPCMSAQAIGGAVGRNPIPILIPCHRVLGKNGKLTGYSGGLSIKQFLLDLEKIPYRS